jgi:hypothetical protein
MHIFKHGLVEHNAAINSMSTSNVTILLMIIADEVPVQTLLTIHTAVQSTLQTRRRIAVDGYDLQTLKK